MSGSSEEEEPAAVQILSVLTPVISNLVALNTYLPVLSHVAVNALSGVDLS